AGGPRRAVPRRDPRADRAPAEEGSHRHVQRSGERHAVGPAAEQAALIASRGPSAANRAPRHATSHATMRVTTKHARGAVLALALSAVAACGGGDGDAEPLPARHDTAAEPSAKDDP